MIINSNIYNEKQILNYQIETYKDELDECYEILRQTKRKLEEKCQVRLIKLNYSKTKSISRCCCFFFFNKEF